MGRQKEGERGQRNMCHVEKTERGKGGAAFHAAQIGLTREGGTGGKEGGGGEENGAEGERCSERE